MESSKSTLHVQVCYALPDRQHLISLTVNNGATIGEAIKRSWIADELCEGDLMIAKIGIYGKLKSLDTALRDGDRVEIYRPLLADPKEARRRRARK